MVVYCLENTVRPGERDLDFFFLYFDKFSVAMGTGSYLWLGDYLREAVILTSIAVKIKFVYLSYGRL